MRVLNVLVPSLFVALAACAATENTEGTDSALSEDGKDDGKGGTSIAFGECGYSREQLIAQVSSARGAAIRRGFEWLDDEVPFSMSARHETYRTDCSGFVSMCWELGAPGQTTKTFGKAGSGSAKLGDYDDLIPADALVRSGKHSFIFLGWNDTDKKGMCVLEQSSTKNDMQFRVRLTATLKSEGFVPVRADIFKNDTTYRPVTPAASSTTTTEGETTARPDASTACTPKSKAEICRAAKTADGVTCGVVDDGCGAPVNCDDVEGFGCDSNQTCTANKCVTKDAENCTPKPVATLCAAAKTANAIECGTIDNGCNGTVTCDYVEGFACGEGKTCDKNKCVAKAPSSDDTGDTEAESTASPRTTQSADVGDEGDTDDDSEGVVKPPSTKKKKASSGCNAASGSTEGAGAFAAAAMFVLGSLRRRNKKQH